MESNKFESIYSQKVKAGRRRTYFFDVRKTKGDDYYVTLTESTRKFNDGGYERHKIFLYKEDFNRFVKGLQDVVDHVKTELMPDYDYDEFAKRYEEQEGEFGESGDSKTAEEATTNDVSEPEIENEISSSSDPEISSEMEGDTSSENDGEDEMSW